MPPKQKAFIFKGPKAKAVSGPQQGATYANRVQEEKEHIQEEARNTGRGVPNIFGSPPTIHSLWTVGPGTKPPTVAEVPDIKEGQMFTSLFGSTNSKARPAVQHVLKSPRGPTTSSSKPGEASSRLAQPKRKLTPTKSSSRNYGPMSPRGDPSRSMSPPRGANINAAANIKASSKGSEKHGTQDFFEASLASLELLSRRGRTGAGAHSHVAACRTHGENASVRPEDSQVLATFLPLRSESPTPPSSLVAPG